MANKTLKFIYAYPLDRGRRDFFAEKGLDYPTKEKIMSVISHWEKLWTDTNNEKDIITYLAKITERIPDRNLECFVFGAGMQAMSTPFLLPIWNREGKQWSDEKFVDLVIHELLHIFLVTDNDVYWEHALKQFADEEPVCRNHVLLYAMLYKIYKDLFNQEPIDFNRDNMPPGYARAIELVKEIGYQELIDEYKEIISGKSTDS
jgi:hypothetical protein